jgi:epoxyqueuosine reductase
MKHSQYKALIQNLAFELGFSSVGFSKATFLVEEEPKLTRWLKAGKHGEMHYLENHFDKRLDPRLLVEGTKTVISFTYNYFPGDITLEQGPYKLSKYAYGEDYHFVVKDQLNKLKIRLEEEIGEVSGRFFVDSAPVLEKAWAQRSGIAWLGKNGNMIQPKAGSFFFLAEWLCDLEIEPDGPMKDYCGTCTRCIDACPTNAITEPYSVDGSKCISYLTIELKDPKLPEQFQQQMEGWMYGCDICQDVCPWNRFSLKTNETRFYPSEELRNMSQESWENLSPETFKQLFKKSAVQRTKWTGLKRNIEFLQSKLLK